MKVPRVLCREYELKRHFAEAYPDVTVKNVTFAYDVKKLQAISSELKDAKSALKYCNKHNALRVVGPGPNQHTPETRIMYIHWW